MPSKPQDQDRAAAPAPDMSLLILSNREPLRREEGRWLPSVGGLTTALVPVLEAQGGTWIAWGEEDAETTPWLHYPEDDPKFRVSRIALGPEEVNNYYYGLANRVLWPLCHYFIEEMDLQQSYYQDYSQVNWRFADQAAQLYQEGDLVWIQDYQLMLVPGLLRKACPGAKIGYFFHIPFPAVEVWRILPWAQELAEGLLGADLIGFHNQEYVDNFLETAGVLAGAEVHGNTVLWNGREIRVEAHPIGIDTARFKELAASRQVAEEAAKIREEAGADYILIGVDRLDYTKGVLERLLAFERFLQNEPGYRGRVSFYQIAAPSRTRVESYQDLKRAVDEVAGRINGNYMKNGWVPVRYLYRSYSHQELAALYQAADIALITPLRDGMNVVAQEFALASKRGALILSILAGAARELTAALLVNPYDVEGVARTIKLAFEMPEEARRDHLAKLKAQVEALDVHIWARGFIDTLAKT